MNEKRIEIGLAKLRKLWKQNKTQIGKKRIEAVARTLQAALREPLTPLSYGNTEAVNQCEPDAVNQGNSSGIEYFTPDFIAALARSGAELIVVE